MPARAEHPTGIASALIDAYRATRYCVTGAAQPFLLHIDQPSADLAACHLADSVQCSAFITAWNPHSRLTAADQNAVAQRRLEARLQAAGHAWLTGLGVDPSGQWEGEESLLVLGLAREAAQQIAGEFDQNGLLWAGADAVPRLLLLR